jgi:hypothetical protein
MTKEGKTENENLIGSGKEEKMPEIQLSTLSEK